MLTAYEAKKMQMASDPKNGANLLLESLEVDIKREAESGRSYLLISGDEAKEWGFASKPEYKLARGILESYGYEVQIKQHRHPMVDDDSNNYYTAKIIWNKD